MQPVGSSGSRGCDTLAAVTTVGHTLTGLSLAVLTLPPEQSRRWYVLTGLCFVFFANIPDIPLPGWGHDFYRASHSVFVTLLLTSLLAPLLLWPTFRVLVGGRVIIAWSVTWLSHMVLDSMYGHGRGIAIYCLFQPACDLIWRPLQAELLRHYTLQALLLRQFAGLGSARPAPC